MNRLFLIRHGETELNAQGRFQGRADSRLNDRGRRQAGALARELRDEPIASLFTSDLVRARETAEIIAAGRDWTPRVSTELRELSFGAWEGLTYFEIQRNYPIELSRWEIDPKNHPPPGGERLTELDARLALIFDEIRRESNRRTIAAVTHGGPIRLLICRALGLPATEHERFAVAPGSLSVLRLDSRGSRLDRLNHVPTE